MSKAKKHNIKRGEQRPLAQRAGLHPMHLNAILCGRRRPSPKTAMSIQEASNGRVKAWDLLFPDKKANGGRPARNGRVNRHTAPTITFFQPENQ